MASVSLKHELGCSAETYVEKCVFSEEFNRRLHVEVLKFPGFTLLSQSTEGTVWKRRAQIEPPTTGVPGPLKKVIGDKLSYIEEGEYDTTTKVYKFKVISSTMPDKTKIYGELRCEPAGDNKCTRLANLTVEVKVFIVGSLAEDKILGDIKQSYEASSKFVDAYVKEKGL
jgi:hypothetical protein